MAQDQKKKKTYIHSLLHVGISHTRVRGAKVDRTEDLAVRHDVFFSRDRFSCQYLTMQRDQGKHTEVGFILVSPDGCGDP